MERCEILLRLGGREGAPKELSPKWKYQGKSAVRGTCEATPIDQRYLFHPSSWKRFRIQYACTTYSFIK